MTACAHAKGDADRVVLKLLDERDPDDARQHRRDLGAEYWRDINDRYVRRYADAARARHFERALLDVRGEVMAPVLRAAGSYGSGSQVPLVALRYIGHGCVWPV